MSESSHGPSGDNRSTDDGLVSRLLVVFSGLPWMLSSWLLLLCCGGPRIDLGGLLLFLGALLDTAGGLGFCFHLSGSGLPIDTPGPAGGDAVLGGLTFRGDG